MGNIAAAAAAAKSSGGSSYFLIFIVLIGGVFWLMMRSQRNKQRRVQEQQRGVTPGQRVKTTAGMYATVVAVDGDDVILEVAPDVEVRYMKRAVMEVLGEGLGATEDGATDEAEESEEPDDAVAEPEGEYADDEGYDVSADETEEADAGLAGHGEHAEATASEHAGEGSAAAPGESEHAQMNGHAASKPQAAQPEGAASTD